ncbi:MAG TPA: glycine cleavage T C-terminal barrel domain-containing protein [Streptosporangiaceae bacterium]|nr:glycine cleavage T C-terminal barrel domain-containing protein [Streptosporangiaceae bacterium]
MDSPLLATDGAVAADVPDAGVAAHYGDPFAEQRALAQAAGLVDRSNRDVLRITGKDRLGWLNSISTQKVDDLAPGSAGQTLILSPKGHVEHHLSLVDDGTETWMHVEPGEAASLLEFLESMRFMLRVEAADASASHAVLTVSGPEVKPDVADVAGAAAALDFGYETDLIVPRREIAAAAGTLRDRGFRLSGMLAHEALRIAGHRPRFGTDTDHRAIPHEMGWITTAVHLNKGCYRGQETVARVHNLGHPPRRLVMLHLDGSEDALPAHGEDVRAEGTTVGFVGSSARHYELGPIALALVKRTVPVTATLTVAGISAAQEVIVPPDVGANVKISMGRRRDL